ncbi:MAG: hypothetical protein M1818_001817 [Claussenomyces sp. TS43310]|nr:MAG: hypothetical protein M1818_001817 [Claussenomyces sp. TS43310]
MSQIEPKVLPQPSAPTFEHHPDGFGIGYARPRLSWRFSPPNVAEIADDRWQQSGYELEVKKWEEIEPSVYRVESNESVLVPWPCKDLKSRGMASVRVRSYFQNEEDEWCNSTPTVWSDWAHVEAGLLAKEDWTANCIASSQKLEPAGEPLRPVRFRRCFPLLQIENVLKARLYVTSLGVYEAYVNGKRVGNHVMSPGWTSYNHRLNYQTFDVTSFLLDKNVLAMEVSEGWYAGRLSFGGGQRYVYGDALAAVAQLEITLKTGDVVTLNTDDAWKCHASARLTSEIYDGEVYDMREEQYGWNAPGFDQSSWVEVKSLPLPETNLIASDAPPVRITEEITPVEIITSKNGNSIIDFGQNLVGVISVRELHLPSSSTLSFSHAEVLENGELAIRPLRAARCIDTVIFSDHKIHNWCPKFTFHGFRYVQVNGWPRTPKREDFVALVLHSDLQRRGWFSCSDPLVNKLHENVVWSMRGNFLSIPTDCPQRDERLGWTGDAQVFCPSATFLYDTMGMFSGWLEDVSAEQLSKGNGIPGLVVPDILPAHWQQVGQAVWHDVVVLTPWDLYCFSGDIELLRRQHKSMKAWIDQGIGRGPDGLWHPDIWQLGDWLDPTAPAEDPGNGKTDGILVADLYLVHVTYIFSMICAAIGHADEASRYASDVVKLKSAFQHKYITPLGLLVNNTQTAVSLALHFQLYPHDAQIATAATSLARLVRSCKFRISTGFAGTPIICHALTATGQTQLAYRMLLEKHCPSWLYPVTMGATTIWERWDSLLPDGSVNPGEMTSFNHYALGSIAGWLHATVGGISSSDGWRTVKVSPIPGGTIAHAEVKFEGPYGTVKSGWRVKENQFLLSITIPPNSKALLTMPGEQKELIRVGPGQHSFSCPYRAEDWPPRHAPKPFWGVEECDCA